MILLEKLLGRNELPCKHYPTLLAGTSAGALNAGLFATGADIATALDFYDEWLYKIFNRNWTWPVVARSKYSGDGIDECLQTVFGSKLLRELEVPLLVCSYSTCRNKAVYFKSWAAPYDTFTVADVLRASMAAPTYFPPKPIYDTELGMVDIFVDGGLEWIF